MLIFFKCLISQHFKYSLCLISQVTLKTGDSLSLSCQVNFYFEFFLQKALQYFLQKDRNQLYKNCLHTQCIRLCWVFAQSCKVFSVGTLLQFTDELWQILRKCLILLILSFEACIPTSTETLQCIEGVYKKLSNWYEMQQGLSLRSGSCWGESG